MLEDEFSIADRLRGFRAACLESYGEIEDSLRENLAKSRPGADRIGRHLGAMSGLMLAVMHAENTLEGRDGLGKRFNLAARGESTDTQASMILMSMRALLRDELRQPAMIDDILRHAGTDFGIAASPSVRKGVVRGAAMFCERVEDFILAHEDYIPQARDAAGTDRQTHPAPAYFN